MEGVQQNGLSLRMGKVQLKTGEHQVALIGSGQQAALDQRHGFLRGMSAQGFSRPSRRGKSPDGFCLPVTAFMAA
jgi:hypothetical protein